MAGSAPFTKGQKIYQLQFKTIPNSQNAINNIVVKRFYQYCRGDKPLSTLLGVHFCLWGSLAD